MGHVGTTGTAIVPNVDPVLGRVGEVEGFNGGGVADLGGLEGEGFIGWGKGEDF